jgi:hypothetical protein
LAAIGAKPVSLNEITYYNIFRKAFVDLGLQSVAVPLIGTGAAGILISECCFDLVEALFKFNSDFKTVIVNKRCTVYVINNNLNILNEAQVHLNQKTYALNKEVRVSNQSSKSSITDDCAICLDSIANEKKLDKCGHSFCRTCIDDYFQKVKKVCPVCNLSYGVSNGNQPNGTMTWRYLSNLLPGFETTSTRTIEIAYNIPSGVQDARHPKPGVPFHGATRVAYLPDTNQGQHVLNLFKKAFDHKLIFTVGQSRTTGMDNTVTWNDIHHKTQMTGGSTV